MIERTILFVDDDVLTQWIMAEALAEAEFDVTSACRGIDACLMLDSTHGFDLLITDTDLPDRLSGSDLARLWHETTPSRPVLYIGNEHQGAVRHLGRHETFLAKPFTPDMLLQAVEFALEEAAYALPQTTAARHCHMH